MPVLPWMSAGVRAVSVAVASVVMLRFILECAVRAYALQASGAMFQFS